MTPEEVEKLLEEFSKIQFNAGTVTPKLPAELEPLSNHINKMLALLDSQIEAHDKTRPKWTDEAMKLVLWNRSDAELRGQRLAYTALKATLIECAK